MAFEIGQQVGDYRIVKQLGQGGMATVYKAYHANLDRYVAIKVLHPSFREDETFFERFRREARIVAQLEHPHIVPVYDFSQVNEQPYLVMKFIEGETLKYHAKREALSLEQTLKYMTAIAQALTYAHNKGILHRDVKPSNVMIDKEDTPYLADFGLARMATRGESTMSQDVLIGTPNYISPEQAQGAQDLGPGTDIYSLGIMLYEVVVGRVPFSADTPYAVIHDHIYKPLPIPSQVNPTVPPAVETVLLKSLAKEPKDRYQSAVGMIDAFRVAVQEADLKELSAADIRIERLAAPAVESLEASNAVETPSLPDRSDPEFENMVRNIVAESMGSTPNIPAPSYGTPPPFSYQHSRSMSRSSRRNFWVLGGTLALFIICIASLFVMINAANEASIDNVSFASEDEPVPAPPEEAIPNVMDLPLDEALTRVENEPDEAAAYLTLALAYLDTNQSEEAMEAFLYAIDELDATGFELGQTAAMAAAQGHTDEAILLWLAAYHKAPDNPAIRNNAGQYIYRQMTDIGLTDVSQIQSYTERFPNSAFMQSMIAQALISLPNVTRLQEGRAENLLENARELDSDLAEVRLIYGNYYESIDELELAGDEWRFARSFEDTPEWVTTEANAKLAE